MSRRPIIRDPDNSLFVRLHLRRGPTTPPCAKPRRHRRCWRTPSRRAAVRLRAWRRPIAAVLGARPGRPHRRAARDVLGACATGWLSEAPRGTASRSTSSRRTTSPTSRRAVRPGRTKLVWTRDAVQSALDDHRHRRRGATSRTRPARRLAVDFTAASPFHTRPLALGADIVMHSATKMLNGHSDVVAGALASARDDALWARSSAMRASHGAILGPFEAYPADPRPAHASPARRGAGGGARRSWPRASSATRRSRACSIPACRSIPGHDVAAPADGERLRLHAVDPGARRRGGGDRDGGACAACGSARPRSAASRA